MTAGPIYVCLAYIDFCLYYVTDDVIMGGCVQNCTVSYWSVLLTKMSHMTTVYLVTCVAHIKSKDLSTFSHTVLNYLLSSSDG